MDSSDPVERLLIEIAVLQERVTGLKEAIKLQAIEYERRLSELNHSNDLQIQRNSDYVSKQLWDQTLIEWTKWRQDIERWRWISLGIGIAGGGLAGSIIRLLGR